MLEERADVKKLEKTYVRTNCKYICYLKCTLMFCNKFNYHSPMWSVTAQCSDQLLLYYTKGRYCHHPYKRTRALSCLSLLLCYSLILFFWLFWTHALKPSMTSFDSKACNRWNWLSIEILRDFQRKTSFF